MCIFHVVIMHDKGNNTKEKGELRVSRSDKTQAIIDHHLELS